MIKKLSLLCMSLILILSSVSIINAANGVSISSNAYTLKVGQTATITVSTDGNHTFDGSASASGAGNGSLSGIGIFTGSSQSFVVKANSVGTINVTVSGQSVDINNPTVGKSASAGLSIKVVGDTPPPTNSGGGSNTIDRPTQVETEAERIARLEREAAAKKEAEEREEAARKEAEAKIPLVTALEVISKSDKHLDKVIKSFDIEESVYEYAYDLPMFIEDISLKVTGAEGATIDYEADHSMTGEKSIIIKASKGEVSQEYTLKLSPSKFEKIVTDDGTVYQDEVLDTAFSDLGYEVKDVEFEGKPVRMFSKDKMNLQMIMNDKKEVSFYRLNDDGSKIENGSVLLMNDEILFVRNELPEELESKTLYGQSYKDVELPALEFLEEVDSSLASKQVAKGWKFDDGSVVNAVNSDLVEDLYYVSAESNVKAAVVAFDASNPTLMYALIGVSTLLVASLMGLVYMILQSRKNRVHI